MFYQKPPANSNSSKLSPKTFADQILTDFRIMWSLATYEAFRTNNSLPLETKSRDIVHAIKLNNLRLLDVLIIHPAPN